MPDTKSSASSLITSLKIEERILVLRGERVLIDADLASLYQVTTKALNQAVKRNTSRFPSDFMFQLSAMEKQEVVTNCDHLKGLKFSKSLPYAFTEHGAIQAASVLNSQAAVDMGIYVVRAFVRLRQALLQHHDLAHKLESLENEILRLGLQHENLASTVKASNKKHTALFQEVFDTLRELMTPPDPPKKRPIGFLTPETKD